MPESETHDQSARIDGSSIEVVDRQPNLRVTDEHGAVWEFACNSCLEFWKNISPNTANPGHCKSLSHIRQKFDAEFPCYQRNEHKWERTWKVLKRFYQKQNDDDLVTVQTFIRINKCFGCLKKIGSGSCFYIDEIQRLMDKAGSKRGNTFLCWFAGHMSQDGAHRLLRDTEKGTFLVRFSETNADKGGFSFAVSVERGEVKHYQILGDPEQACAGDAYNARFRLILHNSNCDNESEFRDLVNFVGERLRSDYVDGIRCTAICPNLPLNATFQGYE